MTGRGDRAETEGVVYAEAIFEMLSTTLDRLPPDRTELFLSKLCLLLALEAGDVRTVADAIEAAMRDLS